MNVLAISCHPDDMEVYCGGTLLRCVKRGDKVTVCHVANGNMGHVVLQPSELRDIRIKEAQRSGSLAGFDVVTCDIGDLLVDSASKEQQDKLVAIMRQVQPDLIITHGPNDYMNDHVAVSELVFKASFSATVPHYEPQLGPACMVAPIYYMENASLVDCEPDIYVDISEEVEQKLQMLACHESQIVWLKDHDNSDVLEETRVYARFRGIQCGTRYAEGFRLCRRGLRPTAKRLLP